MAGGQRHVSAAILQERHGTHCIGGWVGPRAGLDVCGKSCSHRDSISGPCSPYRVAIPTEPSWPTTNECGHRKWSYKTVSMYILWVFHNSHRKGMDCRFSATNGSTVIIRIMSKSFNYLYFRYMCPWQSCWLHHLFYHKHRCIPKCGVSKFRWGTVWGLHRHCNCIYGRWYTVWVSKTLHHIF